MKVAEATRPYLQQLDHGLHRAKLLLKKSGFSNFGEERILRGYVDALLPRAVRRGSSNPTSRSRTSRRCARA
ncbi:MAG: hypothetical protein LC785_10815 [Acidobacteria bacterium]|nr:hypothetical protein [Acidobacteriota bacterium]